jgi:hypothetical protein
MIDIIVFKISLGPTRRRGCSRNGTSGDRRNSSKSERNDSENLEHHCKESK